MDMPSVRECAFWVQNFMHTPFFKERAMWYAAIVDELKNQLARLSARVRDLADRL